MDTLQQLNPRDYYNSLSKKEKAKFLLYLNKRYDYKTNTMSGKLRKNNVSNLRKDETENIVKAIEEGEWRM